MIVSDIFITQRFQGPLKRALIDVISKLPKLNGQFQCKFSNLMCDFSFDEQSACHAFLTLSLRMQNQGEASGDIASEWMKVPHGPLHKFSYLPQK